MALAWDVGRQSSEERNWGSGWAKDERVFTLSLRTIYYSLKIFNKWLFMAEYPRIKKF